MGIDINIFEQELDELDLQRQIFKSYSFFLKTGLNFKQKKSTTLSDFEKYISNHLIFSNNEINYFFNIKCPDLELFLKEMIKDKVNEEETLESEEWPNQSFFSEYLEYSNQGFDSYNGFSTSKT